MAVQLHYYGSVFDLDPKQPDSFWVSHVENELNRARERDGALMLVVDLADGRRANLAITAQSPVVLVTPRVLGE